MVEELFDAQYNLMDIMGERVSKKDLTQVDISALCAEHLPDVPFDHDVVLAHAEQLGVDYFHITSSGTQYFQSTPRQEK